MPVVGRAFISVTVVFAIYLQAKAPPTLKTYQEILFNKETHQTLFEKGGEERGEWECNGGGRLFRVHCTHVWNYHNKIPSCY
jgi:hypothetical protein